MTGHATIGTEVLTRAEVIALSDCEERIERGMKTYVEVGMALGAIRENRLYRIQYDTFEEYCAVRWNFTGRRGRQLIEAAEIGNMFPIENSRQAAELARVPEADRADVLAEATERGNGKPTAEKIRDVAKERAESPAPVPLVSDETEPTPSPGPVDSTTLPADPGAAPAPAAESRAPVPSQEPAPAPSEALIAAVLEALDGHGQLGRSVAEIWTKMPPMTRSATVQLAVEELVRRGRVTAGPVIRGTARWLLTPEPAGPVAANHPAGSGLPTEADEPEPMAPSREVRVEVGRRSAETVVQTVMAEVVAIVAAVDLGEDLITEQLIADLQAAVDLLASRKKANA